MSSGSVPPIDLGTAKTATQTMLSKMSPQVSPPVAQQTPTELLDALIKVMPNLKRVIKQGSGWSGILLAHKMEWFGENPASSDPTKHHRVSRYSSTDPTVINNQLSNMVSVGIQGVISTWFGPTVSPFIHAACLETSKQCTARVMKYALLMDPWICKAGVTAADKAALIIAALQNASTQQILNATSYLAEKYILDFGTGADFNIVQAAFPSLVFLHQGSGFGWPNISNTVSNLASQHSNAAMKIPAVCPNFHDGGRLTLGNGDGLNGAGRLYEQSVWDATAPRRVIDHQAGNLYLDTVATLSNCKTAPYSAIVTWNDHDENTAIEQFVVMTTGTRIGS